MRNPYSGQDARSIYRDALLLQNACNLSGVAITLTEVCDHLRTTGSDTPGIMADPAVKLIVAKLADLCGLDYVWPSAAAGDCWLLADETDEVGS